MKITEPKSHRKDFAKVDAALGVWKPQRWQMGRRNRVWDRQAIGLGTKGVTGA